MSILDRIVADKRIEVAQRKQLFPTAYWEASPLFDRPANPLAERLRTSPLGLSQNTNAVLLPNKTSTAPFLLLLLPAAMKAQESVECQF